MGHPFLGLFWAGYACISVQEARSLMIGLWNAPWHTSYQHEKHRRLRCHRPHHLEDLPGSQPRKTFHAPCPCAA